MWKEADILEKNIILVLNKNSSSITEIAKELKRAKPTISKTVERMQNQDLIKKSHNYTQDARKIEISINSKRIKIGKTHTFYFTYFILALFPFITSIILSFFLKNLFLFVGSSMGILPPLLFILYEAYIKEDKVIVYKNPKITKREKKKEVQEEPKNLLDGVN